jgi:hypothetical protein
MTRLFLVATLGVGLASTHSWGLSFSIDAVSPEVTVGNSLPGNIYIPVASFGGPVVPPVLPPAVIEINIGGEVDGLSFGRAPNAFRTNAAAVFSLDRGSSGLPGTASANEFNSGGGVSEQSSDVFQSTYNGTNTLFADGDGVVQAGNPNPAAFPLGTSEFPTFPFPPIPPPVGGSDLDALDLQANLLGAGSPTGRMFYSLSSASAAPFFTGADVLVDPTGMGNPPNLYANEFQLGILPIPLPPGNNDVDALVVYDDGDNLFGPGRDIILFSLAPNSIYLGQIDPFMGLPVEPGDILMDAASAQMILGTAPGTGAAILHTAESLGLYTMRQGSPSGDNLNALDIVPEPASLLLLAAGPFAPPRLARGRFSRPLRRN